MDRPDTPHPLYRDTMEELLRSYSSDSLGTLTYRLPTRATEEAPPAQSPESLRPVPSTSTESETRPHHIPSPTRRHVSSRVRKSVQTVKAWYKGKKRVWKDRRTARLTTEQHFTPAGSSLSNSSDTRLAPPKPPVSSPVLNLQEAVEIDRQEWPSRITGKKAEAKLKDWFEMNRAGADRHGRIYRPDMKTICITATTVMVAANALVMLLSHMHRYNAVKRSDWPELILPEGVLYCCVPDSFQAFLFSDRKYILTEGSTRQPYDDVQNAFESEPYGDGPERAIIQAALLQVLQRDQAFWRERDGVWYPTKVPHHQKEHTIRFNVVGTLMALTLHVFGCGAHVVSPLIHTLLFKKAMSSRNKNIKAEHLRWSLDFLSKLDESTAMAMIPWMTLKREGKSPRELQNLRGLFAQCDIDVNVLRPPNPEFADEWSLEHHENWTSTLISRLWFGHDIWDSEEFDGIWEGFNVDFGDGRTISSSMYTLKMSPEDLALTTLDRRVTGLSQLLENLEFETASNSRRSSRRDKRLVESFKQAFLLYLEGSGHPEGTCGSIVSEEEFEKAKDNPLCRARIVLKGCRETEMLPLGEWKIKFLISTDLIERYNVGDGDDLDTMLPPPFKVGTCFGTVTVPFDSVVSNMVTQRISGASNRFDMWIHSQFLSTGFNNSD